MIGPSTEELENSPSQMLQKHRGYYVKMIENTEEMLDRKNEDIEVRLKILDEALKKDKDKDEKKASV